MKKKNILPLYCLSLILISLISYPTLSIADINDTGQKITASDGVSGDCFGYSISISNNSAIVGAMGDDDHGEDSGSAYIFEQINGSWVETEKLTASDGGSNGYFGKSVSISGDYAIVGARYESAVGRLWGMAYIFERINGSWEEVNKLTASDAEADDAFGDSVSIAGNKAIIGAAGKGNGAAYIFTRVDGSWVETAKLTASDSDSTIAFGVSVSINNNFAIIGDLNGMPPTLPGLAYLFERSGDSWIEAAKLTASDGYIGDQFGEAVSITDNYMIIGSAENAYIFELNKTNWIETTKLQSDGYLSVSITNQHAVDRTNVYEHINNSWTKIATLTASDGATGNTFGFPVVVADSHIIIGAWTDADNGQYSGAAYIYQLEPTSNQPPIIDSFTADQLSGQPSLYVNFLCTAHDLDGEIYEYMLDYGDGGVPETNSTGSFTKNYENIGIYHPTCTVVDNQGAFKTSEPIIINVHEDKILLNVPVLNQNEYSFSSAFPEARNSLLEAEELIFALEKSVFKKKKHKNKLTSFIHEAIINFDAGTPQSIKKAKKLIEKIEKRVNGCQLSGTPDKNDWIVDCGEQVYVEDKITRILLLLNNVINGLGPGGCVPTSFAMLFIYYFNQHNVYDLSIDISPKSSTVISMVNDIGWYLSAYVKDESTWVDYPEINNKMNEYSYSFQPDTYSSPEFSEVLYEWAIELVKSWEKGSNELFELFKLKLALWEPIYFSGIYAKPGEVFGHASVVSGYRVEGNQEYLRVNNPNRKDSKWWRVHKNVGFTYNGQYYDNLIMLIRKDEQFFINGLVIYPYQLNIIPLNY